MTEKLFEFDNQNYQSCQSNFRGDRNQEFYLGDYSIEPASVIDVRAERRVVGAHSIIQVRSKTRMTFKRSWSHVRQDGIDVAVLWFVKRGSLSVEHQTGRCVARAGDFVVTKSTTPFFMECLTDADSMYETFQVVVPAYSLRRLFSQELNTGFCICIEGREFSIAERLLQDIFADTGELSEAISETLIESALLVLSDAVRNRGVRGEPRQTLGDKRLQEVLRFIDVNLSNPELSISMVAQGCGISPRYLFSLLRLHGTPFSNLVWDKRLRIARQWLSSTKATEAAISEVAYRVGFKSPAHFSRMFKRAFAMSPCECRATGLPGQPPPAADRALPLQ